MNRMIVGIVMLAGCSSALDIDTDDLTRLPSIEQLDYTHVTPAVSHRYWELRASWGGDEPWKVLGAGGQVPRNQLDAATLAALDSTRPPSGFAISCLPGYCYKYIVAVNGSVHAYTTAAALQTFLGDIDSMEEAALVAHARNLYWSPDADDTGFLETSGGWQIVALELVKGCAPVQTDRVHILVRRDGVVRELGREVHSKLENACI